MAHSESRALNSLMLTVADYLAQPPIPPTARIAYGDHPDQFGDLYLPDDQQPAPVVVMIHGGCWRADYDLTPLGMCCAALQAAGYAVWSLEYRRLGNGGGWPQTFHDVARGVDYLRNLAAAYPLHLSQVVAIGHSAGGQLALWLAARHRLSPVSALYAADPFPLAGVVALAAVANLAQGAQATACGSACHEVIDHDHRHLAEASPHLLLPLGVPHHHIVGADDQIVPAAYVADFVAAAQRAGDPTALIVAPECGHFELTTPHSATWPLIMTAARQMQNQS